MKLNHIFILLTLMVFVSCNKQTKLFNSRNDSVEKYLKLASIDTLPFEIRKKYNQKAFSFIDLERNDTVVRWYLCKTALNFSVLKDSVNYYKVSKIHLEKTSKVRDTLNLARFYRYRAGYHKNNTKFFDSSFYYYLKSEKIYKKIKRVNELVIVIYNKSNIQEKLADYLGAEYSMYIVYNLKKHEKNDVDYYDFLNTVGNMNHNMHKYDIAIKYHKKALDLSRKRKLKKKGVVFSYEGTSLNNLGNAYRELKRYDEAIYCFKSALENKEMIKIDPELKGYLLNNIGFCYLKKKEYKKLPECFLEAAKIFDSSGMRSEASISKVYLSEYYNEIKDQKNAIYYSEKALELAKKSKENYYYLYTLFNAGVVNKKKAPEYIVEYHRLNDSLLFQERKARNQYFKIQLETDEIAKEKEKTIQQKWIQTSVVTGLLIIVILLFIIYKQRNQKKEFLLLQNQQKNNEEIYQLMLNQQSKEEEARQKEKKRISLELHDNVMNQLASTRFNLFSLTQRDNTKLAKEHIDKIKAVEDEIRNLTHELVSENFNNENGFTQLIQQLIDQQNQLYPTNFKLEMDSNIDWDNISSEIKMNLYRIIQEAIHNTNKHSKATKVEVVFTQQNGKLNLLITDNGIGFDQSKKYQGIGLQNMQQRMESIGGRLIFTSTQGEGTIIRCSVLI